MILTVYAIQKALDQGELTIQSFEKDNLGAVSYPYFLC